MPSEPQSTFGIVDFGSARQKSRLFDFRELVESPAPVEFAQTSPEAWMVWPRRDQGRSNSCVFQARAKAAGILNALETGEFVEYSAADYNKRSNKPLPGSYPIEAFDLWHKEGVGLETLEPSQKMDDTALGKVRQSEFEAAVAEISILDAFFGLPGYDFDVLVSTLKATSKPIPVGFFGSFEEWNRDVPRVLGQSTLSESTEVRHLVCATPNFGKWQGEDGFTIEDSWGSTGIGGMGVRWITRSFFESRNYIPGLVPTSFKTFHETSLEPKKPKYTFEKDLEFGMRDPDVRALQAVLKFESLFPVNHAGSDYFGNVTQRGVELFQENHGIVSSGTPTTTGFGRLGPRTREVMNKIYS